MDTNHLYYFQQVCKYKSIRKAAENLYITPQGLSKTISRLEEKLGVPLLERKPFDVESTNYGKIVLKYSESILESLRNMGAELANEEKSAVQELFTTFAYGVGDCINPENIYKATFSAFNTAVEI